MARSFDELVAEADAVSVAGWVLDPPQRIRGQLDPDTARAEVAAVGLDVVDPRHEEIRMEFFDVGAVIYFLRKLSWLLPCAPGRGEAGDLRGRRDQQVK